MRWGSEMYRDALDFVEEVARGSAEVNALYREHVADQGELLPHVLMGDFCRVAIETAAREGCPHWLRQLLKQLDGGLVSGVGEVAELVGVSFVENLCGEVAAINVLRPWMGEAMLREVKTICGV
jgi:hypothetical protein